MILKVSAPAIKPIQHLFKVSPFSNIRMKGMSAPERFEKSFFLFLQMDFKTIYHVSYYILIQ